MRYLILLLSLLLAAPAVADDGAMFRKNVSNTPDLETEFAAIRMLPLYVPAQNTAGELVTVSYPLADGADNIEADRTFARPLIAHYTDGHVEYIDEEGYGGFPGHGHRDAYGAVSLDDGNTWQRSNLSKSADLSSFKIKDGRKKVAYPGDVGRTFAASDGNKVLIAWVSRYCGGGSRRGQTRQQLVVGPGLVDPGGARGAGKSRGHHPGDQRPAFAQRPVHGC